MIINRLQATREDLYSSIDGLSNEQLNRKPAEDRWSISQVLYHLAQTERFFVSLLEKEGSSDEGPVKERNLEKYTDRSVKVKAPIEPKSDYFTFEELAARLDRARDNTAAFLSKSDDQTLASKSLQHPVLGPLSLKQTAEFIGIHEKRHIAQIEEIKAELASTEVN
ncbi:DinB family protein [Mesobacillus harenae]|uniref:DinB family protein n=1 Tax=Mesobacillus harenae TaxID=2213203 RepID=UPI001580216F|nr:DinB family protein [Mesobacillus harenae]